MGRRGSRGSVRWTIRKRGVSVCPTFIAAIAAGNGRSAETVNECDFAGFTVIL